MFRDSLKKICPGLELPSHVFDQRWVVHIQPWGQGEQAVLDYLARYAFRIAITNHRLIALDEAGVTFRYKDRKAKRHKPCSLTGHEFMRRYLQHVLPKGFMQTPGLCGVAKCGIYPRGRFGSAHSA